MTARVLPIEQGERNKNAGTYRRIGLNRNDHRAGKSVLREFQPHVLAIQEKPPSPFTRTVLWVVVALLLTAVSWSWISRIPIMTTAPGKFTADAGVKVVQSLNSGTVSSLFVKAGEMVKAGQVLALLDPKVDLLKADSAKMDLMLNQLQQRRILGELGRRVASDEIPEATTATASMEKRVEAAQLEAQHSKIAVDEAQIRQAKASLASADATLEEYVERLAQDEVLVRDASPLISEGAISGQAFTQLKDQAIVDEGQLKSQREQIEQLSAGVAAAEEQKRLDILTFKAARYQDLEAAVGKTYDLTSQYSQAQRDAALDELRAPVNGRVQSVEIAGLGTVVQAGQTAATIVPSDSPLIVEVDLPSSDVGFLKVGQKTRIKLTAFPFEEYGSIPGKVLSVSPTAETNSGLSSLPDGDSHSPEIPQPQSDASSSKGDGSPVSPPTLFYRVRVQPAQTWLEVQGERHAMQAGMTATVDIETGQRRVLEFFLDPIIKYVHSGLAVR